jgi:hypothetical protein
MPWLECATAENNPSLSASSIARGSQSRELQNLLYVCDELSTCRITYTVTGAKGDSHDDIGVSCKVSKPVRREYHRLLPSQPLKA